MGLSGNSRIDVGEITQSTTRGSAMESALSKSLDSATPIIVGKKGKKQKAKK